MRWRRWRIPAVSFGCGLVLMLWACGAPAETPGGPGGGSPPTDDELDCVRQGYPCSFADVPPEVIDASFALGREAFTRLEVEGVEAARSWLEAQAGVAEVLVGTDGVRFRLVDGRPIWVSTAPAMLPLPPGTSTGDRRSTAASRPTPEPRLPAALPVPEYVAGQDRNGDGVVDNRDRRRALVLDPTFSDFEPWSPASSANAALESVPSYGGNVELRLDASADLASFGLWDQYDVVHFIGHGKRVCESSEERRSLRFCRTGLMTGEQVDPDALRSLSTPGVDVQLTYRAGSASELRAFLIVDVDFFRHAYPGGLDDTLVVLISCTAGDADPSEDGAVPSDIVRALRGEATTVFAWTDLVWPDFAQEAQEVLYRSLREGATTATAAGDLRASGLDVRERTYRGETYTTRLIGWGAERPLRIREIVELIDDGDAPLVDGTDMSSSLDGSAGDGDPDVLTITVRLDGIEPGTEMEYGIRYAIDGAELPGRYGIGGATRIDEDTVTVDHRVDLGRDAPAGPVDFDAIVDLPEGGTSRFAVKVEFGGECGWSMTFSGGANAGTYEGDFIAVRRAYGPAPAELTFSPGATGGFPGMAIQLVEGLPDAPATLTLGLSTSDPAPGYDGAMEVGFTDANYQSGDGIAEVGGGTVPAPATFTLTANEPSTVAGSVAGTLWTQTPTGELQTGEIRLDFRAQDGGDCVIYDPTRPPSSPPGAP